MEKKEKAKKTKTRQRARVASQKRKKAHPQGPETEAPDHIDNRDLNEDEQNKRVNNEEENAQSGTSGQSASVEKN